MIRILSIVALCLYGHFCDCRPGTFNLLSDNSGGIRTMSSFGVYDIGDYGDTIDDLRVDQADNDLNYGVSSVQSARFNPGCGSSSSGYGIGGSSIETIGGNDNYVNTLSRSNNIIHSGFENDLISAGNTININGGYGSGLTRFGSGNGDVLNSVYTGCVGVSTPHIMLVDPTLGVGNDYNSNSRFLTSGINNANSNEQQVMSVSGVNGNNNNPSDFIASNIPSNQGSNVLMSSEMKQTGMNYRLSPLRSSVTNNDFNSNDPDSRKSANPNSLSDSTSFDNDKTIFNNNDNLNSNNLNTNDNSNTNNNLNSDYSFNSKNSGSEVNEVPNITESIDRNSFDFKSSTKYVYIALAFGRSNGLNREHCSKLLTIIFKRLTSTKMVSAVLEIS